MLSLVMYHGICLVFLIGVFLGTRETKKKGAVNLVMVYVMSGLVIVSDCAFGILRESGVKNAFVLYFVNMVYFIASTMGVYAWLAGTLRIAGSRFGKDKRLASLIFIPALITVALALSTPWTGFSFTIENGEYIRGSLFFIDAVIQVGYLLASSVYATVRAVKEPRRYMKKKYLLLALFSLPVWIGGGLQALLGIDFNCAAPVVGLAIVYKYGLSNESKDNENLLKAIAQTYSASFIINTDDHTVRTLSVTADYEEAKQLAETHSYETCVKISIRRNVAPEDRITVERSYAIGNVLSRLENNNTYSVIYKMRAPDGSSRYNKATFMKAFSDEDRHEVFLGVEEIEIRQILLQQKADLENEREEFERVKENFTDVIANIIECRDIDSGEHVVRVKNLTQYLCNQVMEDYPEYGLTPLKTRYIVNGSAMHDVGKIMIPDDILLKPGKLSPEEFEVMKTHCEKGCVILDKLPNDLDPEYVKYAKEICLYHHEKYNGRGYPNGIAGDDIPISAQIVSLADCFDALTAKRVYKKALGRKEAFDMIMNGECGSFNPKLLECFGRVFDTLPEQTDSPE